MSRERIAPMTGDLRYVTARRMHSRENELVGVYCYQWRGRNLDRVMEFMGLSEGVTPMFLLKGETKGRIRLMGTKQGTCKSEVSFTRGMWVVLSKNGTMGFYDTERLKELYEDGEALQDQYYEDEDLAQQAVEKINTELKKPGTPCKFDKDIPCDETCKDLELTTITPHLGGYKIKMPFCKKAKQE